MKVTLTVVCDVDEDMGWETAEDVADTLEELIDDAIPSGMTVKVTVEEEEP